MQISIHLGAHCTDNDQLVNSLLKNRECLASEGVAVPNPKIYRGLLGETLSKLRGAPASPDTQRELLNRFVDIPDADQLILSHAHFLGAPHRSFENNMLHHLAQRNTAWLRNLFPDFEVSFCIGIRNPATYVSAVAKELSPDHRATALTGLQPGDLSWADTILSIRQANPDCAVTVWCNEDTPLTWASVMREITGLEAGTPLKGEFDILTQIMSKEGMERLHSYLKKHTLQNELQRRRVIIAFLDRFMLTEKTEDEIDVDGWTSELVDAMTYAYDEDVRRIEQIPGVTLISV